MTDRFERDLLRGSLDLMVLSVLVEGPKYGYVIQKQIREASHERVKLAAGTLYPLLHRLEAAKWIRARWDDQDGRSRKWYELTAAGRQKLQHQAHEWSQYANCIQQLLASVWRVLPRPT